MDWCNQTKLYWQRCGRPPASPTVDTECEVQDVASSAKWWSESLTDGQKCLLQEPCSLSNTPSNTSSPFLCTDRIAELMLISVPATSNMLYQTVQICKSYSLNYTLNMSWSFMTTNPVPFISQVLSKSFSPCSPKTMQAHFQHADTNY